MRTLTKLVELVSVPRHGVILDHVAVGEGIMASLVREAEIESGVAGLSCQNKRLVHKNVLFLQVDGYGIRRVDAVYHRSLTDEVDSE